MLDIGDETKLLQELTDPDDAIRRNAAEVIGEIKLKKCITSLIKALGDESVGVAEAVAEALISIGGVETAEEVSFLLHSDNAVLRNFACEILEKIGESSLKSLMEAMKSPDKDIRKFASDISGTIGSHKAIDSLAELLKDREVNVAAAAAEALGLIGDKRAVPYLIKAFAGDSWLKCSVAKALGIIGGNEASYTLSTLSQDEDDVVVYSVVNALGDVGDEETIKILSGILEWNRPFMTGPIVESLEKVIARTGDKSIPGICGEIRIEPFLGLLNDQEKTIRMSAVKMIGRFKNKKFLSYIVSMLIDKDEDIRDAAKEAIIKIAPTDLTPLLYILEAKEAIPQGKKAVVEIIGELGWKPGLGHLLRIHKKDEDIIVRRAIVTALGKIGNPEALYALTISLKNKDGHIRGEAALSLGRIGTDKAGEAIFFLFHDQYGNIREAAANSLSMFDSDFIREKLISLFHSPDPEERRLALLALSQSNCKAKTEIMFSALNDKEPEVRRVALDSIGIHMRTKKITGLKEKQINALTKMLDDETNQVRMETVTLMPCIKSRQVLNPLLNRLKIERDTRIKYEIVMKIGCLGYSEAVPILLSILKDDTALIRMAAVSALGEIGDRRAVEELETLTDNENPDLAAAAEDALERIEENDKNQISNYK